MTLLLIGAAGSAGALARFWLGGYIAGRTGSPFPWGTFVINISGAFALGLLAGAGLIPPAWRAAVGTGFLGAYTTFSTWNLETVRLADSGSYLLAAANIVLSTAAGLGAAAAGVAAGVRL